MAVTSSQFICVLKEFEKLAAFISKYYMVSLEKKDMSVKGWNWGLANFTGKGVKVQVKVLNTHTVKVLIFCIDADVYIEQSSDVDVKQNSKGKTCERKKTKLAKISWRLLYTSEENKIMYSCVFLLYSAMNCLV